MRIQNLAVGLIALIATVGVYPAAVAQEDKKAIEVLAAARKAIGGKKLDSLKSLSIQAALQRNAGNFQMNSDLELLLELPDKYMRSESSSNPMVNIVNTLGFNGDRPLKSNGPAGIAAMSSGIAVRLKMPCRKSLKTIASALLPETLALNCSRILSETGRLSSLSTLSIR